EIGQAKRLRVGADVDTQSIETIGRQREIDHRPASTSIRKYGFFLNQARVDKFAGDAGDGGFGQARLPRKLYPRHQGMPAQERQDQASVDAANNARGLRWRM